MTKSYLDATEESGGDIIFLGEGGKYFVGHRSAALEDSRLLPLVEHQGRDISCQGSTRNGS